jgi:hypothetical protein
MQRLERQRRERRSLAPQFEIGGQHPALSRRQRGHRKAVIHGRARFHAAMRGSARRHQQNLIKVQAAFGGVGRLEVAQMNWIEGPAKNARPQHY